MNATSASRLFLSAAIGALHFAASRSDACSQRFALRTARLCSRLLDAETWRPRHFSADSEDTLRFAELAGVGPMIAPIRSKR